MDLRVGAGFPRSPLLMNRARLTAPLRILEKVVGKPTGAEASGLLGPSLPLLSPFRTLFTMMV